MQNIDKSDIAHQGWLLPRLPAWMRPYAVLMRMDRPVGVMLLLWPCIWSILLASGGALHLGAYGLKVLILFSFGAFLMRSAGCVVNDLWDRNLDGQVARTAQRPLASGALSVRQALVLLGCLLLLSLIILVQLPLMVILLGFLSVVFVALYPAMKRVTYWPQTFLGLTFNFGALMGWAAIEGRVSLAALALYVAGIFWTLAYDTIYAYQDREDDALVGIKSTALLFGENGVRMVNIFYCISLALFLFVGALCNASLWFYAITILAAVYFYQALKLWRPRDSALCLKLFKKNIVLGFFLAVACALI